MNRLLKNGMAFFRGILFYLVGHFFSFGKIQCGKLLRIYKDVYLNAGRNSVLTIGKHVKINSRATISSLNKGNLCIGDDVGIGTGNEIVCHNRIKIGKGTILGPYVLMYDHDHVFNGVDGVKKKKFSTEPIEIGKNCWLGANVIVLRGTTVGDRCVIGAGTILKGNIPNDSIVLQKRVMKIRNINRESNES